LAVAWLIEAKIGTALIEPGKPWQNGDNPCVLWRSETQKAARCGFS